MDLLLKKLLLGNIVCQWNVKSEDAEETVFGEREMEGERGGGSINTISTDGGPAGGGKRR